MKGPGVRGLALMFACLAGAGDALAATSQVIDSSPEILLVEVRTEPARPPFGTPFDLHFVLHLPRAMGAVLSDTLLPAAGAESRGVGRWSEAPIPGDSVEVRAVFPVIAFVEGTVLLPTLELWIRPLAPVGSGRGSGGSAGELPELERRTLRLGAVQVDPLVGEEGEGALQPRPAAGVLGGEWSLWRMLALGAWSAAGLAAASAVGVRLRKKTALESTPARSPGVEALLRLDELRRGEAHREGRPEVFYATLTKIVRHFASRVDPGVGSELTSGELLGRIEARWGREAVGSLGAVIEVAERVKFGLHRPKAEVAEADWERTAAWIRATPETR
jgi:hypothetical protein